MLSWTDINANAVRFAKKHVDDCNGYIAMDDKAVLQLYGMKPDTPEPQIVAEPMSVITNLSRILHQHERI